MEDACIFVLEGICRKRVGLCQYTLGAVVLVFFVCIFEVHRMTAWEDFHLETFLSHFFHNAVFTGCNRCDQFVVLKSFNRRIP